MMEKRVRSNITKKRGLIIMLISLFMLAVGCADEKPVSSEATVFTVDVIIPKDTYSTNEPFDGRYDIKYQGPLFEAIVLYSYGREGYPTYYGQTKGLMEDIDFADPEKVQYLNVQMDAFYLGENGYSASNEISESVPQGYFSESGTYTYGLSVYDCKALEKALNTDCDKILLHSSDVIAEGYTFEEIKDITPLKTASKTIKVI